MEMHRHSASHSQDIPPLLPDARLPRSAMVADRTLGVVPAHLALSPFRQLTITTCTPYRSMLYHLVRIQNHLQRLPGMPCLSAGFFPAPLPQALRLPPPFVPARRPVRVMAILRQLRLHSGSVRSTPLCVHPLLASARQYLQPLANTCTCSPDTSAIRSASCSCRFSSIFSLRNRAFSDFKSMSQVYTTLSRLNNHCEKGVPSRIISRPMRSAVA